MDAITGELVKPQEWSQIEFHLVKELRMKVILFYQKWIIKTVLIDVYLWFRAFKVLISLEELAQSRCR